MPAAAASAHGDLHVRMAQEECQRLVFNHEARLVALEGQHSADEATESFSPEKSPEEETVFFEPSTFSFVAACNFTSLPFLTGILVLLIKSTMYGMMLVGSFRSTDESLKDQIPDLVRPVVFVAQLISYGLAVVTSDDLVSAFMMIYRGYFEGMRDIFDDGGGGKPQWTFSVTMAFLDGAAALFTTFLLVVTSTTAFDVFLNFAAISFVAALDEQFFTLASHDLIGRRNKAAADRIQEKGYQRPANAQKPRVLQTIVFWILIIITMGSGISIYILQTRGFFATDTLYIQFGDDAGPGLALHSGFYILDKTHYQENLWSSFRYTEERDGGGLIGYCVSHKKWTLSLGSSDPCEGIISESRETQSFNILDTDIWNARIPDNSVYGLFPLDIFYLDRGCRIDRDCGGTKQGRCGDDKRCSCRQDFAGVRCQYEVATICPAIQLDESIGEFPLIRRYVAPNFELVESLECYNHPIYWNRATGDVVFFSGLRWLVTQLTEIHPDGGEMALKTLSDPSFHAKTVDLVDFASSEVVYRSAQDSIASPLSPLSWSAVKEANGGFSSHGISWLTELSDPLVFLCSACSDESNPCLYGGICGNDRTCSCDNKATGSLCQVAPVGNGRCDNYFNSLDFQYDGGDCCKATCEESICGDLDNNIEPFFVGFDSCEDPDIIQGCVNSCYIAETTVPLNLPSLPFAALSSNGRTLLEISPSDGHALVMQREGADWVQRGRSLQFPGGMVIQTAAIGSPPASFVEKRIGGDISVAIAVSLVDFFQTRGQTHILFSGSYDVTWNTLDPIYHEPNESVRKLGVSQFDELTILSQIVDANNASTVVSHRVYIGKEGFTGWDSIGPFVSNSAALSGSGEVLVTCDKSACSYYRLQDFNQGLPGEERFQYALESLLEFSVDSLELDWMGQSLTVVASRGQDDTLQIFRFQISEATQSFLLVAKSEGLAKEVEMEEKQVLISGDGSSVALIASPSSNDGETREMSADIYSLNRTQGFDFVSSFNFTGLGIDFTDFSFPDLAISDDSKTLVKTSGGLDNIYRAEVYEMIRRCSADEAELRVSVFYRNTLNSEFWSIIEERYFPLSGDMVSGNVVYYQDSLIGTDLIRQSISSQEFCLPLESLGCNRFTSFPPAATLMSRFGSPIVSETLLTLTQQNGTLIRDIELPSNSGVNGVSILLDDADTQNCAEVETINCADSQSYFALILPTVSLRFSHGIAQATYPKWSLSSTSTDYMETKDYHDLPAGSQVAEQLCLEGSDSSCFILNFTETFASAQDCNLPDSLSESLEASAPILEILRDYCHGNSTEDYLSDRFYAYGSFADEGGNYSGWLNGEKVFEGCLVNQANVIHYFGNCDT